MAQEIQYKYTAVKSKPVARQPGNDKIYVCKIGMNGDRE